MLFTVGVGGLYLCVFRCMCVCTSVFGGRGISQYFSYNPFHRSSMRYSRHLHGTLITLVLHPAALNNPSAASTTSAQQKKHIFVQVSRQTIVLTTADLLVTHICANVCFSSFLLMKNRWRVAGLIKVRSRRFCLLTPPEDRRQTTPAQAQARAQALALTRCKQQR